jgi:hypothetical protein
MRQGAMCHIKSKKNALSSYVVLYSDIDEVLEEINKNNRWLPSLTTSPSTVKFLPMKQQATVRRLEEKFVLLDEIKSNSGSFYYRCLYNDRFGWIIGRNKSFELEEERVDTVCRT